MPTTELFVSHSWALDHDLAITFGLFFIVALLILFILYYFYRERVDVPQRYQGVPPLPPAAAAAAPVIELAGPRRALPPVMYHSDMRYDSCAICLADFVEGEELVALQCGHLFHYFCCMDGWLTRGTGCPICRASTT